MDSFDKELILSLLSICLRLFTIDAYSFSYESGFAFAHAPRVFWNADFAKKTSFLTKTWVWCKNGKTRGALTRADYWFDGSLHKIAGDTHKCICLQVLLNIFVEVYGWLWEKLPHADFRLNPLNKWMGERDARVHGWAGLWEPIISMITLCMIFLYIRSRGCSASLNLALLQCTILGPITPRSEERRVGKEGRSRGSAQH